MRKLVPLLGCLSFLLAACAIGGVDDVATNERPYDDDEDFLDASVDDGADVSLEASEGEDADDGAEADASDDSDVPSADGSCTPFETEDLGPCSFCGTSVRECQADGTWGDPECKDPGACSPGSIDSQPCGACGTKTRACTNACEWEPFSACEGEGICMPGEVSEGVGDARCTQRTCTDSCEWGPSELKGTAVCDWKGGRNPQCCGSQKWQYCLSSCQWAPCQACDGNASCLNLCG